MKNSLFIVCVLALLISSGCEFSHSYSYSHQERVEVRFPDTTADERMDVAKKIAFKLQEGQLVSEIQSQFPELAVSNIEQKLGIQWGHTVINKATGNTQDNMQNTQKVYIRCSYTDDKMSELGQKVVDACIQLVTEELAATDAT